MAGMPCARRFVAWPRLRSRQSRVNWFSLTTRWSLSVGAMLFLAASPALGQTVRGVITDRASGSPVPGVTIVLLDSANAPVKSTLSDEQGQFTVGAPSAGLYRLRLDAVGFFSETTSELRVVEGETPTRTVVFNRRIRDLPAITVTAKTVCVPAPEAGAAVAALWEEVRKALTVTQLSAEARRYRYDLVQYERELDPRSKAVRRSRNWERLGITGETYESISADSLANYGYVQTTNDGTWYYAPDARTLLSDAFTRTHCLKPVAASNAEPGLVGLGFEPMQQRKISDVRGILWLDPSTSMLRFLQYSYTGLSKGMQEYDFGGRVDFERLSTGAWVVQHWHITMPHISRQVRSMPSNVPGVAARLVPVTVEVVIGIVERGGDVKARESATTAVAARRFATITGSVFDSTANGPLAQADIWLDAPGKALPIARATTDTAGNFRIDSIEPGNYTLTVTHPRLDALGSSLAPVAVNLERERTATLSLATPSPSVIASALCPAGLNDNEALVRGAVLRAASGAAVPGARVLARWDDKAPALAPTSFAAESAGTADESGHFTLCGLPRGRSLHLKATDARSRGEPLTLTLESELIATVNLLAPEHTAEISGVVYGRDGRPISLAEINLLDSDVTVRTDTLGAYRLSVLPAGRHVLEARAIGYAPRRRMIQLRAGAPDTADIRLDVVAQVLKTVKTVASRDRYKTGFHDRMARKTGGHFITNEQIRRSGLVRVTDLLKSVPGLQLRMVGNVAVMEFTGRGGRTFSSHGCPVAYAIDGVPYEPASFGVDGEIGVEHIEAIEVYDAATAPAQFSRRGTGCGVILIWTREKSVVEPDKDAEGDKDDPSARSPREGQQVTPPKRP